MIAEVVFDQARPQVFLVRPVDRHSIFRIAYSQSHGTQSLLISSNRSGSCRHNPETNSAAQFRSAKVHAENEDLPDVSYSSTEGIKVAIPRRRIADAVG